MGQWYVNLKGAPSSQKDLEALFSLGDVRVRKEGEGWILTWEHLDSISEFNEVVDEAKHVISIMNGAAKLHYGDFSPVEFAGVIRIDDDGKRTHMIEPLVCSVRVSTRIVGMRVIRADGTESPARPSNAVGWIQLGLKDRSVADALRFFASPTWFNLYKVFEVVRDDIGGDEALKNKGWAAKSQISAFHRTANSRQALGDEARHATAKNPPPAKPMRLRDARELWDRILRKWIEEKRAKLQT